MSPQHVTLAPRGATAASWGEGRVPTAGGSTGLAELLSRGRVTSWVQIWLKLPSGCDQARSQPPPTADAGGEHLPSSSTHARHSVTPGLQHTAVGDTIMGAYREIYRISV